MIVLSLTAFGEQRYDRLGKTVKAVDDKLLKLDSSAPDGWVLVGRRCSDCSTVFHPVRYRCPRCGSGDLEEVDLPKTGAVRTLTLVHRTGPAALIEAPYYVAIVDIDAGPTIEAISSAKLSAKNVKPGAKVKLMLESIGGDEDGEEIGAYRFALDGNGGLQG